MYREAHAFSRSEVEIASGEFQGRCTTLPRILCNSKTYYFGFILTSRQFPVQLFRRHGM
jgi:hypothetical protein